MRERKLDRRELLVGSAAAAALACGGLGCSDDSGAVPGPDGAVAPDGPSPDRGGGADGGGASLAGRVVQVGDPKSVSSAGELDSARVRSMLQVGLRELSGAADLKGAWKTLLPDFKPGTRVGLKTNCINDRAASSPALVKALVQTLQQDLGAAAGDIIVWDRTAGELKAAGLTQAALGVKVLATDPGDGGPGHDVAQKVRAKTTRLSKILTQSTDVTINLGVLKDHEISGVTGALKNTYGIIDNPGEFHDELVKDLPVIYALPQIRQRTRLCLVEGFIAVATGGPMGPATHRPGKLLLSVDPVAMDAHALALINGLRTSPVDKGQLGWLDAAAAAGLGRRTPTVIKKVI